MTPSAPRPLDVDQVVGAAAALVDEDGIDGLSMTAVANRLGVSQPALYRHVDNAADLLRRVALHARTELLDAIRDAAIGRSGDDALVAVATAWRGYVHRHPERYAATDRSPLPGDTENEQVVERLVDVLARTLHGYGLDEDEARRGAWALRSALHGFATLEISGGNPRGMELDALFTHMLTVMARGYRA